MSIQAMTWALSIPIPPSPKLTLVAIGNYADENGHCFPSIKRLASDSSQSYDTVSRRLRELEVLGLLVRIARHISPEGVLNQEGRGRRTSDEIRLRLTVTPDEVKAGLAAAENEPQEHGPSDESGSPPTPQVAGGKLQGLSPHSPAGTDPALLRDQEPSLEPSKKDSPPTPQAGGDGSSAEQPSEGAGEAKQPFPGSETWPTFEVAYSDPILRQSIARQVWSALTEAERTLAIRAARGYVAWRRSQKKPPNVLNAHTFLRERDAWAEFAKLAPVEPQAKIFIAEQSADFDALRVLALIRGTPPPDARFDVEQATKGIWRHGIVPLDLAALTQFAAKPIEQWGCAEKETKPFYAWSDRIHKWTGHRPEPQRIETGGERPFEWNGKTAMIKNFIMGLRVPCLFPPRKDGSIGPDPLTDAEAKAFLDTG